LPNKLKSNNYSELTIVNVADGWRESDVWYPGRSRQKVKTEYETVMDFVRKEEPMVLSNSVKRM